MAETGQFRQAANTSDRTLRSAVFAAKTAYRRVAAPLWQTVPSYACRRIDLVTQASRIEQQVMYARFVYDKHDHYYVGMEGDLEVSSLSIEDDGIFAPRDVSAIFDQIEMLFDLARKLSEADKERD